MIALSIDTAANYCAAALSDVNSGEILASVNEDIGRGHAEMLLDIIDQCMKQANAGYRDIEQIVSTIGPGSFTGVRVGLATARAIGVALSKPVIGVSNLEACARYAMQFDNMPVGNKLVSVIVDARRNEVYFQQFNNALPVQKPVVSAIKDLEIEDSALCGSGAAEYVLYKKPDRKPVIIHDKATAPIEIIAALGAEKPVPDSRPQPLYLRAADAKIQDGFAVPRCDIENTDVPR
ncbi:MAG: tRNA (adenosine(37)-N6)-threonylcarbamoyltransferase complex dimerization subunit type 1 TsaB [Rhizobiaceae bacterium]|nr:tRNA (adenosine(37)-N6)-threonylcarbamoyltransferase complex dimerization subunit type 1 TsaB [Rhizobiaceae bacterium]